MSVKRWTEKAKLVTALVVNISHYNVSQKRFSKTIKRINFRLGGFTIRKPLKFVQI